MKDYFKENGVTLPNGLVCDMFTGHLMAPSVYRDAGIDMPAAQREAYARQVVHYYPPAGWSDAPFRQHQHIARSIIDTTHRPCLIERADRLRGWRWSHPHNAEEVAFLADVLGDAVAGYGETYDGDDSPTGLGNDPV